MAVLYTSREIQEALRELRIKPTRGLITTKEAASVLTWRASREYGIEHRYPTAAVRRHVQKRNLKIAEKANEVANLYKVEDVFDLALVPRRGVAQRKEPVAA